MSDDSWSEERSDAVEVDVQDPEQPRRRMRLTLWIIVVLVVVAGGVAAYLYGTGVVEPGDGTGPSGGEPSVVAEFEGSGDGTTEEFEVAEGWEIHWEFSGTGDVSVELLTSGDESRGVVIDVEAPSGGTTFPRAAGSFHLAVATEGDWSMQIIQGEPEEDSTDSTQSPAAPTEAPAP